MRSRLLTLAAVAALGIPAASIADQPSQQNEKSAAKFCKALREAAGKDNFRAMFGGGKNAFGKCVSKNAKKDQKQEQAVKSNAAKDCKAERDADPAAFTQKYGTNKNKKNAFGKCVSQKEHESQAAGGGGTTP